MFPAGSTLEKHTLTVGKLLILKQTQSVLECIKQRSLLTDDKIAGQKMYFSGTQNQIHSRKKKRYSQWK